MTNKRLIQNKKQEKKEKNTFDKNFSTKINLYIVYK